MFRKVLIANRGEIACRVIATARRMGIGTVAVFSDADAQALHVKMADEAVHIGAAPAAESYLNGRRIIAAAHATGADAIHPGYGFMSEAPEFVEAVAQAGLIFIGPSAQAMSAMGRKDAAKALMASHGVPIVPGYHEAEQAADVLAQAAAKLGFPVMIKARAGGGGKGMRRVDRAEDFGEALSGARSEAEASFGDGAVLIEKYVVDPRHIEVQVFGDTHGNIIHLGERDCSLQRRHQKVIEEAPAPGMTPEMRAAMGQAAVKAARAVGYVGAGTVEFIVDASKGLREDGFWFMEMNTRLQVEHPVSEALTGLDFVEWQLRIAAGEPLPLRQRDVALQGHAVEARIYAERADAGFLPATGRISYLDLPEAVAFARGPVRVDSGVAEGDEVTPWYDPLLAKVIVHGATRAEAFQSLRHALAQTQIVGTETNITFLSALAAQPDVCAGRVSTDLIAANIAALTREPTVRPIARLLAAVVSSGVLKSDAAGDAFAALKGWRLWGQGRVTVPFADGPEGVRILGGGVFEMNGTTAHVTRIDRLRYRVTVDGLSQTLKAAVVDDAAYVFHDGDSHRFALQAKADGADDGLEVGGAIVAPMPGVIKSVMVAQGATVEKGAALVVLEAMKMEHVLRAPVDGVVDALHVSRGDQVRAKAHLVSLTRAKDN